MGFLSVTLLFTGYILVYAATANHGRYAQNPWAGVFADAYTDDGGPAGPTGPGGIK